MRLIGRRPEAMGARRTGAEGPWGRQEQPYLRAAVLVVAVAVLGLLVYRQVDRWRGEQVTIWVAASNLARGETVEEEDLLPLEVRAADKPEAAMIDRKNIIGAILTRALPEGAAFLAGTVRPPVPEAGPGLAGAVPAGRVLMTYTLPGFPIADLANMLRRGDRFDIFAFGGGNTGPLHMAHDVVFLGWIRPRQAAAAADEDDGIGRGMVERITEAAERAEAPPAQGGRASPLLLGVRPEDVRRLVWAENSGVPLSVVIHGKTEVEGGELLPFPMTRPPEVELILGAQRTKLPLQSIQ